MEAQSLFRRAAPSAGSLSRSRDPAVCAGILSGAALLGLLWLFSIPFQEAPDEAAHFQVVRFVLDRGRLPRFHPDDLWLIRTPSGVVETYAAFPPLAYLVMAGAAAPSPDNPMWAARFVSLACYVATVGLTFAAARLVWPGRFAVAVWSSLAVAFLPQHAFTGAYINNDALGILLCASLWCLLILAWRGRLGIAVCLGIGAVVGALLITKYTFYAVALVGLASGLAAALRQREGRGRHVSALLLSPAVVAGWWFGHNWALYSELIPGRVIAEAKGAAGGNTLFQPAEHGITLVTLSTQTNFWELTLKSFFAGFGFMEVFLDPGHYAAAIVVVLLGLAGVAGAWSTDLSSVPRGLVVTVLAGFGATLLSAMAISAYGEYSPQGRYLFGPLVPFAIALAIGWAVLSRRRGLQWIPLACVVSLGGLNLVSLFGYVLPRYYGPTPNSFIIQIDRPSTPQSAAAPIEVLGWALAVGGVEWRPLDGRMIGSYRRPVLGIDVYLDGPPGEGTYLGAAEVGFSRPDVRDTYGRLPGLELVGFRLESPSGGIEPGVHRIFACARDGAREVVRCSTRPMELMGAQQTGAAPSRL